MRFRSVPLAVAIAVFAASPEARAAGVAVAGALFDPAGKPISNAELVLHNAEGKTLATVTSDAQGHYAFPSVDPGSYVIDAAANGAALGSMTVSVAGAPVHEDFRLQSAQTQALNIVIAKQFHEEARNNLSPQTGTNAYKINEQAIQELPQGDDESLDKVLEQAPGVAEDSFGQVHVRGEHADLQYRINGIILPEGISGFGQTLDTNFIQSMTLLDGALPAQYGYRTAGVVDIQTKEGFDNTGAAEMRVGGYGTVQPSVEYGGTVDTTDYFFSASHLSDNIGIEQPTSSDNPIHDHTEQTKEFGYASYMIDPDQRVEMITGNSISYFQIPNNPGQTPQYIDGATATFNSADLNERQFESNQYGTLAWQGQKDDIEVQIAPYIRSSETHYRPDIEGDLMFNGVASDVQYNDLAAGIQNDNSWRINASHTLRAGFQIQDEQVITDNTSETFLGAPGAQATTTPETIIDNTSLNGQLYGIYVQDEWKLTDRLTMNYGARFDEWASYLDENQLSPRVGFVYKADDATTLHAGYARYFTPPPLELVAPNTVAAFNGTTNASAVTEDSPVKPERTHSFDLGATHQLTNEIKLGVDAYYKISHDLLDLGQFGQALVFTPFNYDQGRVYGTEFTASYDTKDFSAYGNLALSRAMGRDIVSAQFNFTDPAELAYIQDHWVHLDHDQTVSASGGIDYNIREGTKLDLDTVFGSGLRSGFANMDSLAPYVTFDGGITQDIPIFPKDKTSLRFSVINLLDTPYELRSGTGIGVGAPQWGERRAFYMTLRQGF
jgi:outer membrane receptor protein involved in Fe transport